MVDWPIHVKDLPFCSLEIIASVFNYSPGSFHDNLKLAPCSTFKRCNCAPVNILSVFSVPVSVTIFSWYAHRVVDLKFTSVNQSLTRRNVYVQVASC